MSNPSKSVPATLGGRIRWLRLLAGLPARELDRLAGKTPGHALAIENRIGDRAQVETVAAYARVFGVATGWLVDGGDAPDRIAVIAAVESARADLDAAHPRAAGA